MVSPTATVPVTAPATVSVVPVIEPAIDAVGLETVCDVLTRYVPSPPLVPVRKLVIVVPAATPRPIMVSPTATVPATAPVTVSVVPVIEPLAIDAVGLETVCDVLTL